MGRLSGPERRKAQKQRRLEQNSQRSKLSAEDAAVTYGTLPPSANIQPALTPPTPPPENTGGNEPEKNTVPATLPPIQPLVSQKASKEILRYPNQKIHDYTDYLQIAIVGYKSIAENNNESLVGKPGSRRGRTSAKERYATIFLPIPSNVQDGNTVSYSDSSLNNITASLISGGISTMEGFGEALGLLASGKTAESNTAASAAMDSIRKVISNSGLDFNVAQSLLTKQLAASAVGVFGGNVTINQLLSREKGTIFNPNMELLFNGPTLRSFRFSFKMTPRNRNESIVVRRIINTLKRNMAPQVVTTGNSENLFLKTPNVFELTYKQGDMEHCFLHKFKQCFLEDISVNYTGEGTYATYGDGTPISMVMNLQFKELEPIYDIDYEQTEDNKYKGVGY